MEPREQTSARPARRVGTFTFGVTLVVFGFWMLAQLFLPELDLTWCLKLSPLILVLLGVEVLLAARKNSTIKYDWVGMLLCTVTVLTALALFSAAWWLARDPGAVLTPRFDGSRTGSETGLELEYDVFHGQDLQLLELKAGDVLEAAVDNTAGTVSFLLENPEGDTVWETEPLVQASLPVAIPDSGTYRLWVFGDAAWGRTSIALADAPDA